MDFTTGSWFTFSNRVKHKQLHFLLFFPGLTVTVSGISDTWYLKTKYLQRLKFFLCLLFFLLKVSESVISTGYASKVIH